MTRYFVTWSATIAAPATEAGRPTATNPRRATARRPRSPAGRSWSTRRGRRRRPRSGGRSSNQLNRVRTHSCSGSTSLRMFMRLGNSAVSSRFCHGSGCASARAGAVASSPSNAFSRYGSASGSGSYVVADDSIGSCGASSGDPGRSSGFCDSSTIPRAPAQERLDASRLGEEPLPLGLGAADDRARLLVCLGDDQLGLALAASRASAADFSAATSVAASRCSRPRMSSSCFSSSSTWSVSSPRSRQTSSKLSATSSSSRSVASRLYPNSARPEPDVSQFDWAIGHRFRLLPYRSPLVQSAQHRHDDPVEDDQRGSRPSLKVDRPELQRQDPAPEAQIRIADIGEEPLDRAQRVGSWTHEVRMYAKMARM